MERLVPGTSEACKSCAHRLPDEFPHSRYPCAEVKIDKDGIMTSPVINLADVCITYRRDWVTSLRELVKLVKEVPSAIRHLVRPLTF